MERGGRAIAGPASAADSETSGILAPLSPHGVALGDDGYYRSTLPRVRRPKPTPTKRRVRKTPRYCATRDYSSDEPGVVWGVEDKANDEMLCTGCDHKDARMIAKALRRMQKEEAREHFDNS